jgi:hypothetical protein
MIQAALAGKLSCLGSEDALTSAVFGRLRYLPSSVLGRWLDTATPYSPGDNVERPWSTGLTPEYSFWPTWPDSDRERVEPDLLLRYGDSLVVVEAKLWSGKSGTRDQLARQWSVGVAHLGQTMRSARLAAHIYLTAHLTSPETDLAESKRELNEAGYGHTHLWWLSWATLAPILAGMPENPIASDLAHYLREVGVIRFVHWNIPAARLAAWRYEQLPSAPYWRGAHRRISDWRYRRDVGRYWATVSPGAAVRWTYQRRVG